MSSRTAPFAGSILIPDSTRYRWKSGWEYLFTSVTYTIYQSNYSDNVVTKVGNKVEFVHTLVCVFIICMPIQYMQTALGQYSQASAVQLRHLCPIIHGIGYSFILVTFIRIIPDAVTAGDSFLYLLNCLQTDLPWLSCKKYQNCWFSGKCGQKTPCLSADIDLATSCYWNDTFMQGIPYEAGITYPDFRRLVTMSLVWLCIYAILYSGRKILQKFIRIAFIMSSTLRVIVLLILTSSSEFDAAVGLGYLMNATFDALLDLNVWSRTLVSMLCYMCIGRGGNMFLGSFFTENSSSGILTVLSCVISCVSYMIIWLIYYTSMAIIIDASGLEDLDPVAMLRNKDETIKFTIISAGLGYTAVTQIWSASFFLAVILHSIAHVTLNIFVIETTLEDAFPVLTKYRNYLLILSMLINISFSIVFSTNGFFMFTTLHLSFIADMFEAVLTLLLVFTIAWIYGVQKLCDDIHYIIGVQPTKYWKISWYLCPLLITISMIFYFSNIGHKIRETHSQHMFAVILLATLTSPIVTFACIETFKYIKNKNLVGLFQTTDEWGMPNSFERDLRKIFNPRKEIKSQRRVEECQHNCLLRSRVLHRVMVEEEMVYTINLTEKIAKSQESLL